MIAGIVLDDWKLDLFKKRLDEAGYQYTQHPGTTSGTLTLRVKTDNPGDLLMIVRLVHREATKSRMN